VNTWTPDTYRKAWDFAVRHHQGQTYGGAREGERVDYVHHVAAVAVEVMAALQSETFADGELAVQCALLHDTLEDTAATFESVKAEFGDAVAQGVQALSKNPTLAPKALQMQDSLSRILQQPPEVAMVKLADRIANLYHPPFYWDNRKILAYRDEAQGIHAALGQASPVLARRLQDKIDAYPRFLRQTPG
jgi:(p)ppGpp synthase/HD superfamily hydrolase